MEKGRSQEAPDFSLWEEVTSKQIRERIGIESQKSGELLLKSAEDLRNKLAHAQDIVTGTTWPEIIDLAEEIEALLKRCEEIEINKQSPNMA